MVYRTVGKIVNEIILPIRDTSNLSDAIELVSKSKYNIAPVVDSNNNLIGVFHRWYYLESLPKSMLDKNIKKFMSTDYITSHIDDDIITVFEKMKGYKIDEILIVDKNRIVGIVSIYNLYESISSLNLNYAEQLLKHIQSKGNNDSIKDKMIKDLVKEINRLHSEAVTDYLTGLFNIRYFHRRIEEEIERSLRTKQPISIIFIDIDNFKNINDSYGHDCGDKLLIAIADLLKNGNNSELRKTDIAIRYGGEEFIILLPSIDKENAFILAERIRIKIEKLKITCHKQKIGTTVSIGIAEYDSRKDKNILDVVTRSDQAMYQAKKAGKNQVVAL